MAANFGAYLAMRNPPSYPPSHPPRTPEILPVASQPPFGRRPLQRVPDHRDQVVPRARVVLVAAVAPLTWVTVYPASPPRRNARSTWDHLRPKSGTQYLSHFPHRFAQHTHSWCCRGAHAKLGPLGPPDQIVSSFIFVFSCRRFSLSLNISLLMVPMVPVPPQHHIPVCTPRVYKYPVYHTVPVVVPNLVPVPGEIVPLFQSHSNTDAAGVLSSEYPTTTNKRVESSPC